MSDLGLVLRNLGAWSLQVAVLGAAAAALSRLAPIERPATRLAFGQTLLLIVLGLPLVQPWSAATAQVAWSLVPGSAFSAPGATPSPPQDGTTPWGPIAIATLLVLGAAGQLLRATVGLLRLRALRRRARPFPAAAWLVALRDEVAPRATLVRTEETGSPATFGLRRPVVLLPAAFAALERSRQEAVALHELLHARRGDWPALVGEELLKAALFFHPVVHWLVGRIRLAREQTVDAEVVRRLGDREAYLASLVDVARFAALHRAVPAAPFLRESHLRERVDLLLKEVPMSRVRSLAHLTLTAAGLVLAGSWATSAIPLQSAPAALPEGHIAVSDEVRAPAEPTLLHKVNPAYPPEAKADRVQGIFLIDVVVGRDGDVTEAHVVASAPTAERLAELDAERGTRSALEGDSRLAAAALEAVRQWRYAPVLKDGQPVAFKLTVTVNFKLA